MSQLSKEIRALRTVQKRRSNIRRDFVRAKLETSPPFANSARSRVITATSDRRRNSRAVTLVRG
jgi:hypothetical protein